MGGNPWLKLFGVLIAFAVLGYPVWKLTAQAPERPVVAVVKPEASRNLSFQVSFASPPREFTLSSLGKVVMEGKDKQLEYQGNLAIPIPREGIDLLLKVRWLPNTPRTAVQVRVFDQEKVLVDKTFWSEDDLVEVVTVFDHE